MTTKYKTASEVLIQGKDRTASQITIDRKLAERKLTKKLDQANQILMSGLLRMYK